MLNSSNFAHLLQLLFVVEKLLIGVVGRVQSRAKEILQRVGPNVVLDDLEVIIFYQ